MVQYVNRSSREGAGCAAFLVVCFVIPCGRLLATEKLPDYDQKTVRSSIAMVGVDGGSFSRRHYEPALLRPLYWPDHEAEVSPFWVGKYECTFQEFREWVMEWPSRDKPTSPAQEKAREVIDLEQELLARDCGGPSWNNSVQESSGNGNHPALGMRSIRDLHG